MGKSAHNMTNGWSEKKKSVFEMMGISENKTLCLRCYCHTEKSKCKLTLLCFSRARAFTASNKWASLGEASVNTKMSDSGGL